MNRQMMTVNGLLAKKIGLHEAIILQKIFELQSRHGNCACICASYKACKNQCKFLSSTSIEKAFLSLEKQGLLKRTCGCYQLHTDTVEELLLNAQEVRQIIKMWGLDSGLTDRAATEYQQMHNDHPKWTQQVVVEYCGEAPSTIRKLPTAKAQHYFNLLSGVNPIGAKPVFMEALSMQAMLATPDEIFRLEQVFEWLSHLTIKERKLVWGRASKTPWDTICWELGISRTTAWLKWKDAIGKICVRLNEKNV